MEKLNSTKAEKRETPDQLSEKMAEELTHLMHSREREAQNSFRMTSLRPGVGDAPMSSYMSQYGKGEPTTIGLINQSPAPSGLEEIMSRIFPGGVTIEKLLEFEKIRDFGENSKIAEKSILTRIPAEDGYSGFLTHSTVGGKGTSEVHRFVERGLTFPNLQPVSDHAGQLEPEYSIPMDPNVKVGPGVAPVNGNFIYNTDLNIPMHTELVPGLRNAENAFSGQILQGERSKTEHSRVLDPRVQIGSAMAQRNGNYMQNADLHLLLQSGWVPEL